MESGGHTREVRGQVRQRTLGLAEVFSKTRF